MRCAAIKEQSLLRGGCNRAHRFADGVGEVNLGRLMQDDVLIESHVAAHLDGERDAHGRDGRHDVYVVGREHLGELRARPLR